MFLSGCYGIVNISPSPLSWQSPSLPLPITVVKGSQGSQVDTSIWHTVESFYSRWTHFQASKTTQRYIAIFRPKTEIIRNKYEITGTVEKRKKRKEKAKKKNLPDSNFQIRTIPWRTQTSLLYLGPAEL